MVYSKRLLVLFALSIGLSACVIRTEMPAASQNAEDALDMIPAQATLAGFINAEEFQDTFQEFLESDFSEQTRSQVEELRDRLEEAGIDPFQDLDYAVAYAAKNLSPVALAKGDFDVDRISQTIAAELSRVTRHDLDGMTAWTLGNDRHQRAFGISDDGETAVIGEGLEALVAALDAGGQTAISSLAEPVASMDAWVVASELPSLTGAQVRVSQVQAQMLSRAVRSVAAGGSLSHDSMTGRIVLYPKEGIEASDLADLVRGAIAAVRLQEMPDQARTQLEDLEVSDDYGMVTVDGSLSQDTIDFFRAK